MDTKHLQPLFLLLAILFGSYNVKAQTKPNTDDNTQQSPSCIGCTVSNPTQARDASMTTFSTFDVTGLPAGVLGFISRDYNFNTNLPLEDEIIIELQFSDNSLLASLGANVATAIIFDRLQIELLDGNTSIASYGGNGLLSNLAAIDVINIPNSSFHIIIKVPENNVNKIRIKTGALVSLATGVSPSNLLVKDIRSSITERYYSSRFTGNSGQIGAILLASINSGVLQENLAVTYLADPNMEYTSYKWDIGLALLGTEYQFSEYDWGTTPNQDFLGDQDGITDAVVLTLQEVNVADLGLSDLGLNLWSSGGIELFVTYTDLTTATYNNMSSFLTASVLGLHSGRFSITFNIPPNKTVERIEVRRIAPTVGMFSELRLYSIYTIPTSLLPLDLSTFTVTKKKGLAELNWSITETKDVASFEIQHSTDGIDFQTIGKQNCSPQNHYHFTDINPCAADNYYRLKIIDHTGSFSYSVIKNIHFEPNNNNYSVYTHQNQLFVKNNTTTTGNTEITILSVDGKILKHFMQKDGTRSITINSQLFGQVFVINVKHQEGQFTRLMSNL